jgi:hypothetical protein
MPTGDLKTPFTNYVAPMPDMAGNGVTSRGTDPMVDTGGSGAIQTPFEKPILSNFDGQETANSVSNLPLQPNRFEPNETPPEPPTLKDRNPSPDVTKS